MASESTVKSVMVEFNRFGVSGGTLQKGTKYIRTAGFDVPALQIEVGLDYTEFVTNLYALRYAKDAAIKRADALATLQNEAGKMLCDLPCEANGTIQIDLVTGASELWAFPFEAWASAKPGVVLTRRIRGEFGRHAAWPAVPKVLFAHAAAGGDLPESLVEAHTAALRQALRPWTGGDPDEKTLGKYLTVREVVTLAALEKARIEGPFTHVHLLAHGTSVTALAGPPLTDWGMRLGPAKTDGKNTEGVHPSAIAKALAPQNGLPVVVTVASCDSANQEDAAAASYSIAQEIHRLGVPVVVASQLPLTMPGSVVLTRHFYEPLLRGGDVREALDAARDALRHDEKNSFHDWLSVVAYVRLPENYAEHLGQVALEMELAMLRAARNHADKAIAKNDPAAFAVIEELIGQRITSLEKRLPALTADKDRLECQGLLASAHKRLAEVLFLAGRSLAEQRQELEASLEQYRQAFASNPAMHWHGVQMLALQAVLDGAFDPIEYAMVMRRAQGAAKTATEYWALGTLAELHLLAGFAGSAPDLASAREAILEFMKRAGGNADAVDSTWRQLRRYVEWWSPANDFQTDLAAQAAELAGLMTTSP